MLEELGGTVTKKKRPLVEGEVRKRGRPPKKKPVAVNIDLTPKAVTPERAEVVMKQANCVIDIQANFAAQK